MLLQIYETSILMLLEALRSSFPLEELQLIDAIVCMNGRCKSQRLETKLRMNHQLDPYHARDRNSGVRNMKKTDIIKTNTALKVNIRNLELCNIGRVFHISSFK